MTGATDVLHLMFGGFGGQFSVVAQLSSSFRTRGLTSSACLYAPPGGFVEGRYPEAFDDVYKVVKRARLDPKGARAIKAVIARSRPRAILWHVPYAPSAVREAMRHGSSQLTVLVEHTPVELRRVVDDLRSLRAIRAASVVVFQSEQELDGYRLRHLPSLVRASAIIPNGIDLERYSPGPAINEAPKCLHVGMITRMVAQKDFRSLVEAVELLAARDDMPRFRVTLAGDGPDRLALERLSSRLGVDHLIQFVGRLGADDVIRLLRDLHVFVHATFGESVGMSLLEAYGVGLPILTSDVSGVNNMVRDGRDGLMVPPGDANALAEALGRLLREPRLRATLGSAARERALADFGSETMAERYLALLGRFDPAGPWARAA